MIAHRAEREDSSIRTAILEACPAGRCLRNVRTPFSITRWCGRPLGSARAVGCLPTLTAACDSVGEMIEPDEPVQQLSSVPNCHTYLR